MADILFRPPTQHRAYPERIESSDKWYERVYGWTARRARRVRRVSTRLYERMIADVDRHGKVVADFSAEELIREAQLVRSRLRDTGFSEDAVARSFSLVRESARRTLGQFHYDVQLIGGWILLNGMVAEMETGEGKTLTATLAATTVALAGVPTHVITANDYLAKRDAEWMGPVYETLGLKVGTIIHGLKHDERAAAYACDVTYASNKEIVFDYLRDRIHLDGIPSNTHLQVERLSGSQHRSSQLLLRGLYYAIVDEADSVLIDEARTPLIISQSSGSDQERRAYQTALELAEKLTIGRHYKIDRKTRIAELTPAGIGKVEELTRSHGGVWARRQMRQELITQSLAAHHLFVRDRHYLVQDDKVQIIDEYTGRTMPDRSWEHGLHQAIEAKEGVAITTQNRPVARMSYQRFFRRYLRLGGMTGTAQEVARELGSVYDLSVVRIPTNRRLQRTAGPVQVFPTVKEKWSAIVKRVREIHEQERAVLIGTRSVEASEQLSEALTDAGLSHQVLNARQDAEEAEIIAHAGVAGQITVATNMAGRGTDIQLDPKVVERGGLHVIATERHDARRIDRQLFGRCGRQGDPGSYESFVSLEDELVHDHAPKLSQWASKSNGKISDYLGRVAFAVAQHTAERRHRHARSDLLRLDVYVENTLAFAGIAE